MNIPDQLRYTPHHLWVELQPDGTVRAGITDHAQETLGDIVFIDIPAIGASITAGQPCGLIESVKTASDLRAPLTGKLVETNDELRSSPERINQTPYSAWLFRMQPDHASEWEQLLDAEGYRRLLDQ
jgi:glycine cleavage system H protein